ncbi:MAG: ABC transporter permease [Candidatus Nanopelagicales bacterium]
MSADAAAPVSGRRVARERRRASIRRFVRAFGSRRGGVAGLAILALFGLVAVTAPLLFPRSMLEVTQATGAAFEPPSLEFPLGTDDTGRSVLALVAWGARVSLTVGLAATVIAMVIGTSVGIASGHFRGPVGGTLDRVTDWFLVIPYLPLAIVLATVLGKSMLNIIIVIGVTSWPATARLIRAQTLAIESRPYLERARALGGGHVHQMTKHVLPNVMPLVLANTTLAVSLSILAETTLSFLGLSDPLTVSWGSILEEGFASGAISQGAWWVLAPPGLCVVLVVLAFNLVGRAVEDILDPRGEGA